LPRTCSLFHNWKLWSRLMKIIPDFRVNEENLIAFVRVELNDPLQGPVLIKLPTSPDLGEGYSLELSRMCFFMTERIVVCSTTMSRCPPFSKRTRFAPGMVAAANSAL